MEINYKLPKQEILRGFKAYSKVLNSSKSFICNNVRVFFRVERNETETEEKKQRLYPIKMGILVSKKKVPKASKRNRVKRLIRESYRLNKNLLNDIKEENLNLTMIFSLTDIGYERFTNTKNFKMNDLFDDVQYLLKKIKKHINKESVD